MAINNRSACPFFDNSKVGGAVQVLIKLIVGQLFSLRVSSTSRCKTRVSSSTLCGCAVILASPYSCCFSTFHSRIPPGNANARRIPMCNAMEYSIAKSAPGDWKNRVLFLHACFFDRTLHHCFEEFGYCDRIRHVGDKVGNQAARIGKERIGETRACAPTDRFGHP
jgi:hypothetical protein